MRYQKGHKDVTRRHIIDVAARRFRSDGVAAAGLAGVMADAGLTNGAFYTHFDSKDDLVRETLLASLEQMRKRTLGAGEGEAGLGTGIRDYLSARHRDHPETGCPTSALIAEIARQPKKTRMAYGARLASYLDLVAGRMSGGSTEERHRRATALHALLIGTLQLARAVNDRAQSDRILADGIAAALDLAGIANEASVSA